MVHEFLEKYSCNIEKLKRLKTVLVEEIESILNDKGIKYYSTKSRVKDFNSLKRKLTKKKYETPAIDLTDLIGIRIIVMQISDVTNVEMHLRRYYKKRVDEVNSINKDEKLDMDRVGYRSIHLIIRTENIDQEYLPNDFNKMKYEIQIRTTLSNLWAEMEHDRRYKGYSLSNELAREFSLFAGTFELLDYNFFDLLERVDKYNSSIAYAYLLDSKIDNNNFKEYLEIRFGEIIDYTYADRKEIKQIVEEIYLFSLENQTIRYFDLLIKEGYLHKLKRFYFIKNNQSKISLKLIVRSVLIIHDYDRYFIKSWGQKWNEWSTQNNFFDFFSEFSVDWQIIEQKYGVKLFRS